MPIERCSQRADLVEDKGTAAQARTLLPKQHGPSDVEKRECAHQNEVRRQDNDECQRRDDVEQTFKPEIRGQRKVWSCNVSYFDRALRLGRLQHAKSNQLRHEIQRNFELVADALNFSESTLR